MRPLKRWKRSDWIGLGIGFLIAFCFFGPYILEPTDPPKYVDVRIVSYRTGSRGSEYFKVVSVKGQSWEVGAARGPFSSDYRGPAVLAISRGRWTGKGHFRLLESKTVTNQPNVRLEPTPTNAVGSSHSVEQ